MNTLKITINQSASIAENGMKKVSEVVKQVIGLNTIDESETSSSVSTPKRVRSMQNFLLAWLDANINEADKDFQNSLQKLRHIVFTLELFIEPALCIEYLKNVIDQKIFLIVSGTLGETIVPVVHDLIQLDTIFVFCRDVKRHKVWAKKWSKIEGVYNSIDSVCVQLKQAARKCDYDAVRINFVLKSMTPKLSSNHDSLDSLEPSYLYSLLFTDIILDIHEDDAKQVKDMIAYYRSKGVSEAELEKFENKYEKESTIWCYTSELFLYGVVNRALRTFDMEAMIKMSFFIRNLHQQLERLYKQQANDYVKKFTVYRGQTLTQEDFQRLMNMTGGLLSFSCFLSTSKKEKVAMRFAKRALQKYANNIGILFIITIDPKQFSASTLPFALVDDYSAVPGEKEILFSLNTVFRIHNISQSNCIKRLWEVKLTFTDESDPQLASLKDSMQKETDGDGWYRMGKLMLRVGDFNQAEELYNELIENASNYADKAHIYHQLGWLRNEQGRYEEAASLYEASLRICKEHLQPDDPLLASNYNNIGLAYSYRGDYARALYFYEKSTAIKERILPRDHPDLAVSYNNIGSLYKELTNYTKALEYYEKALRIYKQTLPNYHPDLATIYNSIGQVYNDTAKYTRALEYSEKAHRILEKTLPPNHSRLALSKHDIGLIYHNTEDYATAGEFYEQAVQIAERSLPPDHPYLSLYKKDLNYVKTKK